MDTQSTIAGEENTAEMTAEVQEQLKSQLQAAVVKAADITDVIPYMQNLKKESFFGGMRYALDNPGMAELLWQSAHDIKF